MEPIEPWRKVWREGFLPSIPTKGLEELRNALIKDDETLRQGCTTDPPPLEAVAFWPCQGACLVGYCGWKGFDNVDTIGKVEEWFARLCYDADQRLGEPAACRYLLNWWDDYPRHYVRKLMLEEVEYNLKERDVA